MKQTPQQAQETGYTAWWGCFGVEIHDSLERSIGPLTLRIDRQPKEWRVLAVPDGQQASQPAGDEVQPNRFVFSETRGPLRLTPALADRPVVTRPVSPFNVAPGQELTVYISSPVWARIEVGEPPGLLQDFPIVRPSDTWFGLSTREGDLCYASRTEARLEIGEIPQRPDRAVTAARIHNETAKIMLIERISLPVPHLAIFATGDGRLWTQSVTLLKNSETDLLELSLEAGPPDQLPRTTRVADAREQIPEKSLFRAFSTIFQ